MQWCCLQVHRLKINESAILFLNCFIFLNILLFYFVPKSQEDNFIFNYTVFFVNYDEGQYIPNFFIQLIYIYIYTVS